MAILALDNVSKSFGALPVSQNISFEVQPNEILGIIGPNGAGKSTLFNLITGNIELDHGQIHFESSEITKISAMERCHLGFGRTFQIPQPFEKLSVFENLLVAGTFGINQTESAAADSCAEILVETKLIEKANVNADSLNLLERKRLELARALATHPKILLLDEIAGGLTEGEGQELVETIQKLHQRGITIIWIEHVLEVLLAIAHRLLVLNFGKVVKIGKPDDIMKSKEVKEIYLGLEV